MTFWNKEPEESPVVTALLQQLHQKDTQIASLLERQRETNILLKSDQEQMVLLRDPHISSLPYASLESHQEQMVESEKKRGELNTALAVSRAGANKSSFFNLLLIASLLLCSFGFSYWFDVIQEETSKSNSDNAHLNYELEQHRRRSSSLASYLAAGRKENNQLSFERAVAKENFEQKEQELIAQLLIQSQRIKHLETVNSTLLSSGLSSLSENTTKVVQKQTQIKSNRKKR